MKKISLSIIIVFSFLISKGQTWPNYPYMYVGSTNPINIADGAISPLIPNDNPTLEIHATKLNIGQVNTYTTHPTNNSALFNVAAYSDGKEIVRFRTNNNTGYFTMYEATAGTFGASFTQAGSSQLYLAPSGTVGIGTSTPHTQSKLNVAGNLFVTNDGKLYVGPTNGSILANMGTSLLGVNGTAVFVKAKVALYGATTWPDYVFSPSYELPKLDTLETFIKANRHLPEIPTADDIKKDGIDLGDTQVLLLKKIEELTLIIIEQNKRIEEQAKKVASIEKQMVIPK